MRNIHIMPRFAMKPGIPIPVDLEGYVMTLPEAIDLEGYVMTLPEAIDLEGLNNDQLNLMLIESYICSVNICKKINELILKNPGHLDTILDDLNNQRRAAIEKKVPE